MERSDIRVLHCESLPLPSEGNQLVLIMAAWEILGSRFARSGLRPLAPPPHVRVGIFIVKNRRETMAPRFLQPAVCIAILACRSVARSRPPPARPAGRIPALAFLKLHGCGLLYFPVFSANTTNQP